MAEEDGEDGKVVAGRIRGVADIDSVTWKSTAAREAFSEICKLAGMERDRILEGIRTNKGHSEYERQLLNIHAATAYLEMIERAYNCAHEIEVRALSFHASLSMMNG